MLKLLEWKFKKLLSFCFYQKKISLTKHYINYEKKFKKKIKQYLNEVRKESSSHWFETQLKLLDKLAEKPLHNFLSFKEISNTMFFEATIKEFDIIKQHPIYIRKRGNLTENALGEPKPYPLFPQSSGNLLHHFFSLIQILNFCNYDTPKMFDSIVEIGGGYGSFSRLAKHLNFEKQYFIYDLPAFSFLQDFYLNYVLDSLCKIELNSISKEQDSISLINSLDQLKQIQKCDLLIGLWSLSEMPIELRNNIFDSVSFNNLLIAFQTEYDSYDNIDYFNKLEKKLQQNNYKTTIYPIKELNPGSFYFLATKK